MIIAIKIILFVALFIFNLPEIGIALISVFLISEVYTVYREDDKIWNYGLLHFFCLMISIISWMKQKESPIIIYCSSVSIITELVRYFLAFKIEKE